MSEIKVSIIVPVYKVSENYLRKCIESCINQTLKEIEVILVEDGSPDNCGKVCDEYAEKDKRIRVIHKENSGVSTARNVGVLMANGEYIGFVDADDWIECDFYEKIFKYAIENNVDIAISGFVKDINGKSYEILQKEKSKIFTREKAQYELLKRNLYVWGLWDKIYRTKLIKGKIVFDKTLHMGEDLDFIWKVLKISQRIGYISLNKYHYVKRMDSVTLSNIPEKKWDSIKVMKKILDEIVENNLDIKILKRIKSLYVKEMASSIIDMIISSPYRYKNKIIFYQKNIRDNLYLGVIGSGFDFKIKIGIVFSAMPYCICCKFSSFLLTYRR